MSFSLGTGCLVLYLGAIKIRSIFDGIKNKVQGKTFCSILHLPRKEDSYVYGNNL